jgi:putative peptidoglycan lipid II flippase
VSKLTQLKNLTSTDRRVLLSALIVAAGFAVSKFTGVLDDFIVARVFGAGRELDAYYAAFKLPDLLFTLIAGGAMAAAFICVRQLSRLAIAQAHSWLRRLSPWAGHAAAASVAAWIAPWLVRQFLAPGFEPDQQLLTASLMRLVLVQTAVFSVSGIVMSALQAHQHFLLPALATVMYNLGIIGGAMFLARPFTLNMARDADSCSPSGTGRLWSAVGVVLARCTLIQVPGLIRFGARWSPYFARRSGLRRVLVCSARAFWDWAVQLNAVIDVSSFILERRQPGQLEFA